MRLKLLSAIASLFIFCITIVSCLGSNDPVDYPVDATIWEFKLDTVGGLNKYKFTIDQMRGLIYNVDSVPHTADTIINKILVKLTSPNAYPLAADTFFNQNDSINLLEGPLRLKMIAAADGVTTKDYTISVRIHKQDPDTLVWTKLTDRFTLSTVQQQKAISLGDNVLIYTSHADVYQSLFTNGKNWTHSAITGLPNNIKLNSIINYKDELYAVTEEDGRVFNSENGLVWTESTLSGNVEALITSFPEGIAGIVNGKFALSNEDATTWTSGGTPDNFPKGNISSTSFVSRTGIWKSVAVGKPENKTEQTVIWSTEKEMNWAGVATDTKFSLPYMDKPSIMYYNDKLYAYGGDFSTFYVSNDYGLIWNEIEKKFLFPDSFKDRGDYSSFVDKDNFIWIIWTGQAGKYTNEVWKGRLNKLGFEIQ